MSDKTYPPIRCERHGVLLVDIVADDNVSVIAHECASCVPVELVNVVRQLHRRRRAS